MWVLDQAEQTLVIDGLAAQPVPSILRGFSAPVRLQIDLADDDLLMLLRHDTDSFNRWQSGQDLALRLMRRAIADG